jgi:hypothetical protein
VFCASDPIPSEKKIGEAQQQGSRWHRIHSGKRAGIAPNKKKGLWASDGIGRRVCLPRKGKNLHCALWFVFVQIARSPKEKILQREKTRPFLDGIESIYEEGLTLGKIKGLQ